MALLIRRHVGMVLRDATFVFSILILFAEAQAFAAPPQGIEEVGGTFYAPEISFTDENGISANLEGFRGKVVILNFWATFCGPCVVEMPSLERLSARLPTADFAVIAVSQDKGGVAIAEPFLERIGVTDLDIYFDPNLRLSRELSVRGLPTTFIIGPEGSVIGRLEGAAEWDSESIVSYLGSVSKK